MSTLGTLNAEYIARMVLGGESVRFDNVRSLLSPLFTTKVNDTINVLSEGQSAASPTTLWTSGQHAASSNPQSQVFRYGALIVDPDDENLTAIPLDVEIATTLNNATTVVVHPIRRVEKWAPLFFSSSYTGAAFSDLASLVAGGTFSQVTRIRARNPNPAAVAPAARNDVKVRLLLLL